MEEDKSKLKISLEGFDPWGLKSLGEISKDTVKFGLDGVKEFLNLTCKPLFEELGLGGKDIYRNWRLLNVIKMLEKAQGKLAYDFEKEKLVIDPRVAFQIVEHSSIISNETLQDMWAGLFASSCNSYEEDENIFFIDILKRLTTSQVKFINYLCNNVRKTVDHVHLPLAKQDGTIIIHELKPSYDEIMAIMQTDSKLKADSEINALINMGLIEVRSNQGGVQTILTIKNGFYIGLKPSLIAVLLYIKCQGSSDSPYKYFLSEISDLYFNSYGDVINVVSSGILETIYEMAITGKQFEDDIKLDTDILKIQRAEWLTLSNDEINFRLKHFIIYWCLHWSDKTYDVDNDNRIIGTFNLKDGFISVF